MQSNRYLYLCLLSYWCWWRIIMGKLCRSRMRWKSCMPWGRMKKASVDRYFFTLPIVDMANNCYFQMWTFFAISYFKIFCHLNSIWQCLSLSFCQNYEVNIAVGYENGKNVSITNSKTFSNLQIVIFCHVNFCQSK